MIDGHKVLISYESKINKMDVCYTNHGIFTGCTKNICLFIGVHNNKGIRSLPSRVREKR